MNRLINKYSLKRAEKRAHASNRLRSGVAWDGRNEVSGNELSVHTMRPKGILQSFRRAAAGSNAISGVRHICRTHLRVGFQQTEKPKQFITSAFPLVFGPAIFARQCVAVVAEFLQISFCSISHTRTI